jgi:hypothetical protein
MKSIISAVLLLTVYLLSSIAQAHHSFRGVFDFSKHTTLKGAVVKFELLNPHARVFMEVINENDETEHWVVEAPGRLSLVRRGWTDDMFDDREMITATGNPSSTGKMAIWLEEIILSDGTKFIDPLVSDDAAIEAERQERIQRAAEKAATN